MTELILNAKDLAQKLGDHRTSSLENELSKVFRQLSEQEQLEIVDQLLKKNVHTAAAIAMRGQISVAQQILLLQCCLRSGQTNTLKVLVSNLFIHRLGAKVFTRSLAEYRLQYPKSVIFAAYYFLAVGKMNSKARHLLQLLLEATSPMVQRQFKALDQSVQLERTGWFKFDLKLFFKR